MPLFCWDFKQNLAKPGPFRNLPKQAISLTLLLTGIEAALVMNRSKRQASLAACGPVRWLKVWRGAGGFYATGEHTSGVESSQRGVEPVKFGRD